MGVKETSDNMFDIKREVALMKLSDDESDSDDEDLSENDALDDTFNHPTPNINLGQDDESDSDDDLYVENVNHPTPNINSRHYLSPDELTTRIPKKRRLSI
ncbi:19684_t:CDS:1 [Gigaspora rosea]|nr:19684_t:CDS:1 [Gigaspora rosea]